MILVKTPLRISFFGGGSDLPAYYNRHEGFCLSTTINQFMYVSLCKTSIEGIKVVYSEIEVADHVESIRHDRIRETLKLFNIKSNIEISSFAEIPTKGTGLGSSSTFTVGLLNGICRLANVPVTKYDLAETACSIEIEKCKEPIGKQDQYAAAFGGLNCFTFNKDRVGVSPVNLSYSELKTLDSNLLLFYTGIKRNTSDILQEQSKKTESDQRTFDSLDQMVNLGKEAVKLLYNKKYDDFGSLIGHSWDLKKKLSSKISSSDIDTWYEEGIKSGAYGGKVVGAGGGGFLLFYVPPHNQSKVITNMERLGCKHFPFQFSNQGSEVVYNDIN
jgi:D-glycero-alpha-D-manno-heptose-7-phosphate kinase